MFINIIIWLVSYDMVVTETSSVTTPVSNTVVIDIY